jgi:hypothetical protein
MTRANVLESQAEKELVLDQVEYRTTGETVELKTVTYLNDALKEAVTPYALYGMEPEDVKAAMEQDAIWQIWNYVYQNIDKTAELIDTDNDNVDDAVSVPYAGDYTVEIPEDFTNEVGASNDYEIIFTAKDGYSLDGKTEARMTDDDAWVDQGMANFTGEATVDTREYNGSDLVNERDAHPIMEDSYGKTIPDYKGWTLFRGIYDKPGVDATKAYLAFKFEGESEDKKFRMGEMAVGVNINPHEFFREKFGMTEEEILQNAEMVLPATVERPGLITPRTLTMDASLLGIQDKIFDNNDLVKFADGTASLALNEEMFRALKHTGGEAEGVIAADMDKFSFTASGTYLNGAEVGQDKAVNIFYVAGDDPLNANYVIQPTAATADILPVPTEEKEEEKTTPPETPKQTLAPQTVASTQPVATETVNTFEPSGQMPRTYETTPTSTYRATTTSSQQIPTTGEKVSILSSVVGMFMSVLGLAAFIERKKVRATEKIKKQDKK